MRKQSLLKTMLLLCVLIVGSSSAWAEGEANWSYTVTSSDGNKLNTQKKTFTVDADHVWSYEGTEVAAGEPTVAINGASIKFGSSKSIYFNPVILSTSAFSDKAITKVNLRLKHNGKKVGNLTVKQGDITIGTATTDNSNSEIDVTCSTTNKGAGGTLEIKYEVDQALYIYKIEVWYEEMERDYWIVTYNYNDGVTSNEKVHVQKTDAATYALKAAPSRDLYNFDGWKIGESTYEGGAAYPLTGDITATAQWSWDGTLITYNKSNKSDLATGAKYIMAGSYTGETTTWKYATAMGTNTYLGADVVGEHGTLNAVKAEFSEETPEIITLNETADGWTMTNASGQKIGLKGDKKLGYDAGDTTWDLGGTDEVPTLSATYSDDAYIMKFNWNNGSSRFNAYTSAQNDVYFYRLDDGKNIYTLTLDFNDENATVAGVHKVLEGATYTLTTPTRAGYAFVGWNTEEDGTGTSYSAGEYTMPAAATTLYAQWSTSVSVTITATGYNTFSCNGSLDLSTLNGATAYVATEVTTDGLVKLEKTTDKVPAGTGLFIKGTAGETYTIDVTSESPTAPESNLLVGAPNGIIVTKAANGQYNYVFGWTEVTNPGFYLINTTSATLPAGKAYLHTTSALTADLSRLGIILDDGEVTGVADINRETITNNGIFFDLQGRRVANPTKGLYIINGKKVVIK